MATLSMVSVPIATSSLPLSARGRSSSVSFPVPKKGGIGHGGLRIECIRIGGVEIPNHKRVEYSLQYIHGIGRSRSRQILLDLNFDNKVTKDLSEEEVITLRKEVTKYMIEGDLVMALSLANSSLNFFSVILVISMVTLLSYFLRFTI